MLPQILERLRAGDREAQVEARRELLPRIEAVCRAMLDDASTAEETAEDIFLDFVLHHAREVQQPEAVSAYVRMMTVRRCVRVRDHARRHEAWTDESEARTASSSEESTLAALDAPRQASQLNECLGKLRPHARKLLRLRYHDGVNQTEIGAVLGLSKQYVGRVIARSLEALRQCMEASG